jgi:hypothetical protein
VPLATNQLRIRFQPYPSNLKNIFHFLRLKVKQNVIFNPYIYASFNAQRRCAGALLHKHGAWQTFLKEKRELCAQGFL